MNGPQENRVGNGNWGDYDNPFDSNQGNSAYNRGNGGYEVKRPVNMVDNYFVEFSSTKITI